MNGSSIHSPFLFALNILPVGTPDGGEFHISLNGPSSTIHDVHFKSRKGRTKSGGLPLFDREIAVGGAMVTILRQTHSVAAHVCPAEVENADTKSFHATDLPFYVGDSRHKQQRGSSNYSGSGAGFMRSGGPGTDAVCHRAEVRCE